MSESQLFKTTVSGNLYHPYNLKPEQVYIDDIAHSLAMQCRFNGHCTDFYSYAEHSILVSELASHDKIFKNTALNALLQTKQMNRLEAAMFGLLHDANKAYTNIESCALSTIQKSLFPNIDFCNSSINAVTIANRVARGLELQFFGLQSNAETDENILETIEYFKGRKAIHCFGPASAERHFLGRFELLKEDM